MRGFKTILYLFGAVIASPAMANPNSEAERFWIQTSAFAPSVRSTVQIAQSDGPLGTRIELEDDLNLNRRKKLPSLEAGWNFANGWGAIAQIYRLRRSNALTLQKDIEFDGEIYPVSSTVKTSFDSDIYRIVVSRSVIDREKFGLKLLAGAHVTRFTASIAGELEGGNLAVSAESKRRKVLAPLPTVGLMMEIRPVSKIRLGLATDVMALKIGDYRGKLLNVDATAGYQIARNFTLGAGYRFVDYRLDVDKSGWTGKFQYRFRGPTLFARFGF